MNDAYPFKRKLNYEKLKFLIGSSQNSIEWWPGPNDLRKWNWLQYAKYVTTSLDSFGNSSISQIALQFYKPDFKNFKFNNNLVNRKFNLFDTLEQFDIDQFKSISQSNSNNLNNINQLNNDLNSKNSKLNPEQLYTRMVSIRTIYL